MTLATLPTPATPPQEPRAAKRAPSARWGLWAGVAAFGVLALTPFGVILGVAAGLALVAFAIPALLFGGAKIGPMEAMNLAILSGLLVVAGVLYKALRKKMRQDSAFASNLMCASGLTVAGVVASLAF